MILNRITMCEVVRSTFEDAFPYIAKDIEEAAFIGTLCLFCSKVYFHFLVFLAFAGDRDCKATFHTRRVATTMIDTTSPKSLG